MIFGGYADGFLADGYVFETEQSSVRQIANGKDSIRFLSSNNVEQVVPNSFITVVWAWLGHQTNVSTIRLTVSADLTHFETRIINEHSYRK